MCSSSSLAGPTSAHVAAVDAASCKLQTMPMLHRVEQVWQLMGSPRCALTGGYLRDCLLDRTSNDLDFSLDGDAGQARGPARRLAAALSTRAHLLGTEPRWVWRIVTDELKIELWPRGSLSLEQDIQRRDLSCNALVWLLPERRLVDLVGGLMDLHQRVLRALSRDNLAADPVRLLRVARFLATLDRFQLDTGTEVWVRELAPMLAAAPPERIGQELLHLLAGRGAARGLRAMVDLGLLAPAAPDACVPDAEWTRQHQAVADLLNGSGPHPVRRALAAAGDAARIALLLRLWQVNDQHLVAPYGWPRQVRLNASTAAGQLDRALVTAESSPADRRQLIHETGHSFPVVLALAAAVATNAGGDPAPWRRWWLQWRRNQERLVRPDCLLSADVIATLTGVAPGPALGQQIRRLVTAQVRGQVRTPAGARRFLRGCGGSGRGQDR